VSESITERLIVNSKQMLNWGVRRGLCADNVLLPITPKADFNIVKKTCSRVLTDDEIKMLWFALEHSRIAAKNKLFVKLCLMYACRNGELRLAKKSDFDFESNVWTIPVSNHKAGKKSKKPLYRPITDSIKPYLLELFALSDGDFLLTNAGKKTQFSINAGVSLPYHINQWLRKNTDYDMAHWSLHDLRRTARTHFSSLCQPHIAEIMLGHTLPGEWMTYDQYAYLEEQRAAYSAWVDRLMGIVS
jgi:integrase